MPPGGVHQRPLGHVGTWNGAGSGIVKGHVTLDHVGRTIAFRVVVEGAGHAQRFEYFLGQKVGVLLACQVLDGSARNLLAPVVVSTFSSERRHGS